MRLLSKRAVSATQEVLAWLSGKLSGQKKSGQKHSTQQKR